MENQLNENNADSRHDGKMHRQFISLVDAEKSSLAQNSHRFSLETYVKKWKLVQKRKYCFSSIEMDCDVDALAAATARRQTYLVYRVQISGSRALQEP